MTATRRHILRRIHRETGANLRQLVRTCRGLTAADIWRQHLAPVAVAVVTQDR